MRITTHDETTAFKDYMNYFFLRLKVGICIGVQPMSIWTLKSGVGKSWTALEMGVTLDENFDMDNIVFEPNDFTRAMRKLEDIGKPSQVVVIDEAGILVNARKWNTLANQGIANAIQTFRELKGLVIFVAPDVMILDRYIRMYVSHLFKVDKKIVDNRTRVIGKFYRLGWVRGYDKYYRRRITLYSKKHKRLIRLNDFVVDKVPPELSKPYEKRMSEYKKKTRNIIGDMEVDDRPLNYYVTDFLDRKFDSIPFNRKVGRKHVFPTDIKERYNLSVRKSNAIARMINSQLENETNAGE